MLPIWHGMSWDYDSCINSGVASAIAPPGSVLTSKKYAFSYVAIKEKSFFWTENLRFQNSCPLWKFSPPALENFLATPLEFLVREDGTFAGEGTRF